MSRHYRKTLVYSFMFLISFNFIVSINTRDAVCLPVNPDGSASYYGIEEVSYLTTAGDGFKLEWKNYWYYMNPDDLIGHEPYDGFDIINRNNYSINSVQVRFSHNQTVHISSEKILKQNLYRSYGYYQHIIAWEGYYDQETEVFIWFEQIDDDLNFLGLADVYFEIVVNYTVNENQNRQFVSMKFPIQYWSEKSGIAFLFFGIVSFALVLITFFSMGGYKIFLGHKILKKYPELRDIFNAKEKNSIYYTFKIISTTAIYSILFVVGLIGLSIGIAGRVGEDFTSSLSDVLAFFYSMSWIIRLVILSSIVGFSFYIAYILARPYISKEVWYIFKRTYLRRVLFDSQKLQSYFDMLDKKTAITLRTGGDVFLNSYEIDALFSYYVAHRTANAKYLRFPVEFRLLVSRPVSIYFEGSQIFGAFLPENLKFSFAEMDTIDSRIDYIDLKRRWEMDAKALYDESQPIREYKEYQQFLKELSEFGTFLLLGNVPTSTSLSKNLYQKIHLSLSELPPENLEFLKINCKILDFNKGRKKGIQFKYLTPIGELIGSIRGRKCFIEKISLSHKVEMDVPRGVDHSALLPIYQINPISESERNHYQFQTSIPKISPVSSMEVKVPGGVIPLMIYDQNSKNSNSEQAIPEFRSNERTRKGRRRKNQNILQIDDDIESLIRLYQKVSIFDLSNSLDIDSNEIIQSIENLVLDGKIHGRLDKETGMFYLQEDTDLVSEEPQEENHIEKYRKEVKKKSNREIVILVFFIASLSISLVFSLYLLLPYWTEIRYAQIVRIPVILIFYIGFGSIVTGIALGIILTIRSIKRDERFKYIRLKSARKRLFLGIALIGIIMTTQFTTLYPTGKFYATNFGPYEYSLEDPSTTRVISWQTDSYISCVFRCSPILRDNEAVNFEKGLVNESVTLSEYEYTITTPRGYNHRVILRNLTPSTKYFYYVEGLKNKAEIFYFSTAPAISRNFNFLVYGDPQRDYFFEENHHPEVLETAFNHFSFDMILNTGDIAGTGWNLVDWKYYFETVGNQMENNSVPIYLTMGNHEWYGDKGQNRDLFFNYDAHRYYSFNHSNVHFLVLDAFECWSQERGFFMSETQLNFMREDLARNQGQKWLVASIHKPLFSSGNQGHYYNLIDTLVPIFDDYGVDVVFSGHEHVYESFKVNGTYYITTGGAGGPQSGDVWPNRIHNASVQLYQDDYYTRNFQLYGEEVFHFIACKVVGEQLIIQAIRSDGSPIQEFILSNEDYRTSNIYTIDQYGEDTYGRSIEGGSFLREWIDNAPPSMRQEARLQSSLNQKYGVFVHFKVPIPRNALITNAILTLTPSTTQVPLPDGSPLHIHGMEYSSIGYLNDITPLDIPLTDAYTDSYLTSFQKDIPISFDVSAIVQEIVNQNDYLESDVGFMLYVPDSVNTAQYSFYQMDEFDSNPGLYPYLEIDWL